MSGLRSEAVDSVMGVKAGVFEKLFMVALSWPSKEILFILKQSHIVLHLGKSMHLWETPTIYGIGDEYIFDLIKTQPNQWPCHSNFFLWICLMKPYLHQ